MEEILDVWCNSLVTLPQKYNIGFSCSLVLFDTFWLLELRIDGPKIEKYKNQNLKKSFLVKD